MILDLDLNELYHWEIKEIHMTDKNCGCANIQGADLGIEMCGTGDRPLQQFYSSPKAAAQEVDEKIYKIPLTFYVIGTVADQGYIDDEFIRIQLQKLNEDYRGTNPDKVNVVPYHQGNIADSKIEFVHDETIRKISDQLFLPGPNSHDMYYPDKGGLSIKPSSKFCAVMYCNFDWAGGFSHFPSASMLNSPIDGNVIRIGSVKNRLTGQGWRIATHEIGHWLNLPHTFQGACTAPDDSVLDTPPITGSTSGCPVDRMACDTTTPAMINSYMDYSSCLHQFSNGQKARMRATLETVRAELVSNNPVSNPTTISFVSPTPGQVFPVGSNYRIEMNPQDADGIAKVELYMKANGGLEQLMYTFAQAPYYLGISQAFAGSYTVRAVAYDINNNTAEATVSYSVGGVVDSPMTIQISSPVSGSELLEGSDFLISAQAVDPDGVAKVDIYLKVNQEPEKLLQSFTAAPYGAAVVNPKVGDYIARAVGTDSKGNIKQALPVSFKVKPRPSQPNVAKVLILAGGKKYKWEFPESQ